MDHGWHVIRTRVILPHEPEAAAKALDLAAAVRKFDCDVRVIEAPQLTAGFGWPAFISDQLEAEGIEYTRKNRAVIKTRRPLFIIKPGFEIESNKLTQLIGHEDDILHGDWGAFLKPKDVVFNFCMIWFRRLFHARFYDEETKTTRPLTVDEAFETVREELKDELTVTELTPAEAGLKGSN